MPVTTKKVKSPKITKAQAIRIVVDDELNKVLNKFKNRYPLLSNSEIIKIIISDGLNSYKNKKGNNLINFLNNLNQENVLLDEDKTIEEELLNI